MQLSDIKCGDEVYYQGQPHIAIRDGRRSGTTGDAATLASVWLAPTADAGIDDAGVLEFGRRCGHAGHVPDAEVNLLRRGVEHHSAVRRSVRRPDGALACEHTNYTATETARSEVRRRSLIRKNLDRLTEEAEPAFRAAIRDALADGVTVAEIQAETGLSRARIYQIRDNRR